MPSPARLLLAPPSALSSEVNVSAASLVDTTPLTAWTHFAVGNVAGLAIKLTSARFQKHIRSHNVRPKAIKRAFCTKLDVGDQY